MMIDLSEMSDALVLTLSTILHHYCWMWGYTLYIITPLYIITSLTKLMVRREKKVAQYRIPLGDQIYNIVTNPPPRHWFSIQDVCYRYSLAIVALCWAMVSKPLSFALFTYRYNSLWYGGIQGSLCIMFLPLSPIVYLLRTVKDTILNTNPFQLSGEEVTEWSGSQWFIQGQGIAGFMSDAFVDFSNMIGNYWIGGCNADYITSTFRDEILVKSYYRDIMERVGCKVPKQLGLWDGEKLQQEHLNMEEHDIVIKLNDSYLGIGDSFLYSGKDFTTKEDIHSILRTSYKDKTAIVMELVRPDTALGVHSLDFVTVATPEGEIELLSCLVWSNCSNATSHTASQGYSIDIMTERTVAPLTWYCQKMTEMEVTGLGTHYPGVCEAAQLCVAAHKEVVKEHPWAKMIGWDSMVLEGGEMVFFEGNLCSGRGPRRLFLHWRCLWEYLTKYAQ